MTCHAFPDPADIIIYQIRRRLDDWYDPRIAELQDALSTTIADWANAHSDKVVHVPVGNGCYRTYFSPHTPDLDQQKQTIVQEWERRHPEVCANPYALDPRVIYCMQHQAYEPYLHFKQLMDGLRSLANSDEYGAMLGHLHAPYVHLDEWESEPQPLRDPFFHSLAY